MELQKKLADLQQQNSLLSRQCHHLSISSQTSLVELQVLRNEVALLLKAKKDLSEERKQLDMACKKQHKALEEDRMKIEGVAKFQQCI